MIATNRNDRLDRDFGRLDELGCKHVMTCLGLLPLRNGKDDATRWIIIIFYQHYYLCWLCNIPSFVQSSVPSTFNDGTLAF
jgi:hypothetical protein